MGISIYSSPNTTLISNLVSNSHSSTFRQQGLFIQGSTQSDFANNISETNKINNLPVLYQDGFYRQCANNSIYTNGSLYSYMGFVGCSGISISNLAPRDHILLAFTENSTIKSLPSMQFTQIAIYLSNSRNNTISNNAIVQRFSYTFFKQLNAAGAFVIILDGFDEMKYGMVFEEFQKIFVQVHELCTNKSISYLTTLQTQLTT